MTRRRALVVVAALLLAPWGGRSHAATSETTARPAALADVDYEQRLGNAVPTTARFRDSNGNEHALGDYLGRAPLVLVPAYYRCPMLCSLVLESVARALRGLATASALDFEVVTFSIDPHEEPALAAEKKTSVLGDDPPIAPARWHFLTGDEPSIRALADAIGFRYAWDEAHGQWAHPAGIVVITPTGRVSRYLFGVDYAPRDLRLALVEASAGRLGTVVDRLLLFCYQYDPSTGADTLTALRAMRIAGLLTLVALGCFVVAALRRERRRAAAPASRRCT